MKKIREWISIQSVKAPKLIVLLVILLANFLFLSIAAFVIMWLAPPYLEPTDYWSCIYYAITMLLSGYIEIVVWDIGATGAAILIFCVFTVILGMVVFTGAVIGYVTEFIAGFIEDADSNSKKLHISNHTIILNWNTRAAEIVNELLSKNTKEKVVVLVKENRDDVLSDIEERLSDTLEAENEIVKESAANLSFFKRRKYIRNNTLRNKLTIVVREGESWSTRQLSGISIETAKSVIILSERSKGEQDNEKGDSLTIKTLLQVVQLTTNDETLRNQQIVVEVEDDKTLALVETIISHKSLKGRHNIVPIAVNHILGQIFSQISIMPELNVVYSELFSNKDSSFYTETERGVLVPEDEFISSYLNTHLNAIPLTVTENEEGEQNYYYMAVGEGDIKREEIVPRKSILSFSLNPNFEISNKHVIILGHNSKNTSIMEGFSSFHSEWQKENSPEVLDIIIIDSEQYLEKYGYYKEYPFVSKTIAADVFEKDLICSKVDEFITDNNGDMCILILSDDMVSGEEIDADALTYLILIQDILSKRMENDPTFNPKSIDMVVEILNPKNYEIVSNYSINNIVVSNRYISKIIAQIGEKGGLFDFYYDILTYDEPGEDSEPSKEMYIKRVQDYFIRIPKACTAAELIRGVYHSSPKDNKAIVLGYVRQGDEMILFEGDQSKITVELKEEDKLIIFSNH